jgi:flavin-dependent dehydrogenase
VIIKNLKKIVIVGGGSAGWMSAAMLIKFFPDYDISVIESPDYPTVGVGESTLLGIRNYCAFLGIDEQDFMSKTDASYKMSIKFTNFYEKNSGGFHYPFGDPELDGTVQGIEDWFYKKAVYPNLTNDTFARYYYPSAALYENSKFSLNTSKKYGKFDPKKHTAFHFDATKFGLWLKEGYCLPRGVKLISDTVTNVKVSDIGIEQLELASGGVVTSDLFVDCTGWKSLLLGDSLKEEFISYSDMLPNNRAWATRIPYKDKDKELEPYTNCTALGNGWVWNIPIWSRLGTGYVYSDRFTSKEDALEEFKQHLMSANMICPRSREEVDSYEYKDIPMRVGIHRKLFVKNVVAIGLSAGFIEPLESNGLFSVHVFLDRLVKTLASGSVNQFDRDVYNTACRGVFQNFAEFVAMHYAFSKRDDTAYWKANNDRVYDKGMTDLVPSMAVGFNHYHNNKMWQANIDPAAGLVWIATGMNHHIIDVLNQRNAEFIEGVATKDKFAQAFTSREQAQMNWWRNSEKEISLHQFLKENIHKDNS